MSESGDRLLHDRYPSILQCYLAIDGGWDGIVDGLCDVLEAHAEMDGRTAEPAIQIKEKLASLRFYRLKSDHFERAAVGLACTFSHFVCESCGAPGRPHGDRGRLVTLCADHAAVRGADALDLAGFERPAILPLDFDQDALRKAHADILTSDAGIYLPDGWLTLAHCVLDFIGGRNADGVDRVRRGASGPGYASFQIGDPSHPIQHQVTLVSIKGDALALAVVPSDDEEIAGMLACAEALSRRIDRQTGTIRILPDEQHRVEVKSRDTDANRPTGLYWLAGIDGPMPEVARWDAASSGWYLPGSSMPLSLRPIVLERVRIPTQHLPTKTIAEVLADARAEDGRSMNADFGSDYVIVGDVRRDRHRDGDEYVVVDVVSADDKPEAEWLVRTEFSGKGTDRTVARKAASNPPTWIVNRVAEATRRLRVGSDRVEILGWAPMLHAGWECHSAAVLTRLPGGRIRWVVVDDNGDGRFPVADMLRERLVAYRDAITATERLLVLAAPHERIEDALDDDAEWQASQAKKREEQ